MTITREKELLQLQEKAMIEERMKVRQEERLAVLKMEEEEKAMMEERMKVRQEERLAIIKKEEEEEARSNCKFEQNPLSAQKTEKDLLILIGGSRKARDRSLLKKFGLVLKIDHIDDDRLDDLEEGEIFQSTSSILTINDDLLDDLEVFQSLVFGQSIFFSLFMMQETCSL